MKNENKNTTYLSFADKTRDRKWYLIDATNYTVGRLATIVARILRGKHKSTFTSHLENGDVVVIINANKVRLTGKKPEQKLYRRHSHSPGSLKEESFNRLINRIPNRIIEKAVKGMLPKSPLGRKLFKNLKVYSSDSHPHKAQKPERLEI